MADSPETLSANAQRPPGVCVHCALPVAWSLRRGAYATADGAGTIICEPRGRDSIGRAQLHELDAHGGGVS